MFDIINDNHFIYKSTFLLINLSPHQLREFSPKLSVLRNGKCQISVELSGFESVEMIRGNDDQVLDRFMVQSHLKSIDSLLDYLLNCIAYFSEYSLTKWNLFPIISSFEVLLVDGNYVISKYGIFTPRYDEFCESIASIVTSTVMDISRRKHDYRMNINIKPKFKAHECRMTGRVGGILQKLCHNSPLTHAVLCADSFDPAWLKKFWAMVGLSNEPVIVSLLQALDGQSTSELTPYLPNSTEPK